MLRAISPLLLLSPFALTDDSPRLGHDAGTEVTRTWSVASVVTTESATITVNEDPQDMGSGSTRDSTVSIAVKDTIRGVKDGAATAFTRSYDAIERDTEIGGFEEADGMEVLTDEGASELVGLGVEFEWDDEAEAWTRAWDDDASGDDDWLEDLTPDMDLSAVLPDEGVEVGATWDVPVRVLGDLLMPGGTLEVRPSVGGDLEPGAISIEIPEPSEIGRWAEMEGTVRATYAEIVEEDGPRVARIVLDVDVEGELDIASELEDAADERGSDEEYAEATLTRTLEGKITVEWDLAAGRFAAVDGALEGTSEFYGDWTISVQGFDVEIQVESSSTSEIELSATQS